MNAKHAALFVAKVIRGDGCWEFSGYHCHQGYGRAWNGQKAALAHRVAYELWVGPIPVGLVVDHLCFNRGCVNPAHLRVLTVSENCSRQRDASKTHCVNGHEFTPENTRIRTDRGIHQRECRLCNRDACRRYHAKKRTAA